MSSVLEKDIEVGKSSLDNSQHDGEITTPEAEGDPNPATEAEVEDESEYITGIRLYLIIMGLCMAVLLIGLVCFCCPKLRQADLFQDNAILATVTTIFCFEFVQ